MLPSQGGTVRVCGCEECGKVVWQIAGARSLCSSPTSPNWALLRLVRKAREIPRQFISCQPCKKVCTFEWFHLVVPNMADSSPNLNKNLPRNYEAHIWLRKTLAGLTLVAQNIREGVQVGNCMRSIMRCVGLREPPSLHQQFYLQEPGLRQFRAERGEGAGLK